MSLEVLHFMTASGKDVKNCHDMTVVHPHNYFNEQTTQILTINYR